MSQVSCQFSNTSEKITSCTETSSPPTSFWMNVSNSCWATSDRQKKWHSTIRASNWKKFDQPFLARNKISQAPPEHVTTSPLKPSTNRLSPSQLTTGPWASSSGSSLTTNTPILLSVVKMSARHLDASKRAITPCPWLVASKIFLRSQLTSLKNCFAVNQVKDLEPPILIS